MAADFFGGNYRLSLVFRSAWKSLSCQWSKSGSVSWTWVSKKRKSKMQHLVKILNLHLLKNKKNAVKGNNVFELKQAANSSTAFETQVQKLVHSYQNICTGTHPRWLLDVSFCHLHTAGLIISARLSIINERFNLFNSQAGKLKEELLAGTRWLANSPGSKCGALAN